MFIQTKAKDFWCFIDISPYSPIDTDIVPILAIDNSVVNLAATSSIFDKDVRTCLVINETNQLNWLRISLPKELVKVTHIRIVNYPASSTELLLDVHVGNLGNESDSLCTTNNTFLNDFDSIVECNRSLSLAGKYLTIYNLQEIKLCEIEVFGEGKI